VIEGPDSRKMATSIRMRYERVLAVPRETFENAEVNIKGGSPAEAIML
jgi:hypothetical protein